MSDDNYTDGSGWTVVLEWWETDSFQHRIRTKQIPDSAHWNVQKQSRGPGGSYTTDWITECRLKPSVYSINTDSEQ